MDGNMKTRIAELIGFNSGVNYPEDLTGAGNFQYDQTQHLPTTLELIDLIKSREIDQYDVVLLKKKEEQEYDKENIRLYHGQ